MTEEGTHGYWGDLHRTDLTPETADISVMGIPFDGLASARKGAALAPERLRYWSRHLTPFSEDRTRLKGMTVCDLGDIEIANPEADFVKARQRIETLPNIPIVLGGDHSVTIPVLQGQRERYRNQRLGILWVDAHPDLCDFFDGSRISHANTMRRALDFGIEPHDVCMVGLRSWEEQEINLIENGGIHVYTAADVAERGMRNVADSVYNILNDCDAVHISLDIDCLDPSVAPGTGIPEFGGLTSRDVLTLIKSTEDLPLVGLDVVEIAPPLDPSESTVFAGLKIIMEYIAVLARRKMKQG
jgi:agmatinase